MGAEEIRIRPLTAVHELRAVEELQQAVWGMGDRAVVPDHQLLAAVRAGGLVLGAFAGEILVGFCYGFPAFREGERFFYSHMTGVRPEWRWRQVGYHLKCAQRAWALEQGYDRIVWTYDPLQSPNAHFNLHKLGATARRYFVDYYGEMRDALNRGLPSDRLEVDWWLQSERVRARLEGGIQSPPVEAALPVLEATGAEPGPVRKPKGKWVRIAIPPDLTALRDQDPDVALRWRLATREAFCACFAAGYTAVDFVRTPEAGWYLLEAEG